MNESSIFQKSSTSKHKFTDEGKGRDEAFKKIFSRKPILAAIIREIVPDFAGMMPNEIAEYIQSSKIDELNAETLATEDLYGGSKIIYDIIVTCALPSSNSEAKVNLLFDLEMQQVYNMSKYRIIDRAVYYTSRLLARQSVLHSKYSDLMPVYSVWICTKGIPKELQNTAHSIRLQDSHINSVLPARSLFNVDMLLLSEDYDWDTDDADVIKFVQSVLKNNMSDRRFNPYVEVSDEMQEELTRLQIEQEEYEDELESIRDMAREEGLAAGREEGLAAGREEGREEGLATGLAAGREEVLREKAIRMYDKDYPIPEIADVLDLSEEDVQRYINGF